MKWNEDKKNYFPQEKIFFLLAGVMAWFFRLCLSVVDF